jgi:hypothetical protein
MVLLMANQLEWVETVIHTQELIAEMTTAQHCQLSSFR